MKHIPKSNLKYVKEVRPGGMIASGYDLEGLRGNLQNFQ